MAKEKISAIIPARNEAKTIKEVLKIVLDSRIFDEVVVVDGASEDDTVKIAESMGVRVLKSQKREGKGMAMKNGLSMVKSEIVAFFDADLVGLTREHILKIVGPVLDGEAAMCIGERSHYWGLPYIIAKIDLLLAIGGERAIRRSVLENIPEKFIQNFATETAMNHYCRVNNLPIILVKLEGVQLIPKEKKWGLIEGFLERVKEIWQVIKIRILVIIIKRDFKNNNHPLHFL